MYQNRLIQNFNNQGTSCFNNQLSNVTCSTRDSGFHQKMIMTRMEQMKKINNVSDLGLSKEQIIDYIICPLRAEKSNRDEIEKYVNDEELSLTQKFLEETWWKQRTNIPYKNILKHENWNKTIKSQNDLVVHKITSIDKIGLIEEYDKLVEMLEKHNNELKLIYSTSKETDHKKQFEYINKYKYRMAYDPKNSSDLKEYYKNEQKKIEKEHKRIDEIISRLTNDNMEEDEIKQLESQFISSNLNKCNVDTNIKTEEKYVDEQIMQLLNEHGKTIFDDIDNKLDINKEQLNCSDVPNIKIKVKRNQSIQDNTELNCKTIRIQKKK